MAALAPVPSSAAAKLEHLVWRGDSMAAAATPGLTTGHARLDAILPGGGWPVGALTEILVPHTGVGELGLLLPLLGRVPAGRWGVCIAPPEQAYAPALAAAGVPLERLLFVRADSPAHARWAARQALDSHSCTLVILWLADADMAALRRLQLAAEESATALFLIRPEGAAHHASPAVLRLALSARDGGVDVRVIKRRGPQLIGPVAIDLPGPTGLPGVPASAPSAMPPAGPVGGASVHALVRPSSARPRPADLRARTL